MQVQEGVEGVEYVQVAVMALGQVEPELAFVHVPVLALVLVLVLVAAAVVAADTDYT